ncbi:type II toxin-antitoxin system PemK/MazF family toxin [Streptomyces sp. NPDC019990]|uniref:type II toxin-antitoxin system PemK/MazF family toxin n=1 Tax=Streptomyces sp. NPDC019990 TaxID=3154693 RepID=UPI0034070A6C
MDTSWWLVLAAVVLLALVATLVDGWGRRSTARREPAVPAVTVAGLPRPAEIWWAEVPFEDEARAKDRPCLVLSVCGERATVAKITTRSRDGRGGVIPLPPGSVGDARGRAGFLETDELREVPVQGFRRRVGVVDPVLWDRVRYLAG